MNQRDFFNNYILNIAILWNFADFYTGEQIAAFLGLPLILFGRLIYFLSIDLFYLFFIFIFLFTFCITFIGLQVLPIERFNKLLLPKILGFIVSLFYVKTKLINFFLLGGLYNIYYFFIFKNLITKDTLNIYFKDALGLSFFWEKYLLLFTSAFLAGIGTNLTYHLLKIFSFVF